MRFSINAIRQIYLAFFVCFGLVILFLPLPHSGDGWGYASDILEYANHPKSLISPHHILHLPLLRLFLPVVRALHLNPIACFTLFNWFLAFIILEIFSAYLLQIGASLKWSIAAQWFVLGSFGFFRFASENEAYMLPLFFSILGSLLILKSQLSKNQINTFIAVKIDILHIPIEILGFGFLATAVLFHQSYIFWLLAFAMGNPTIRLKKMGIFTVLITALTYAIIALKTTGSVLDFVFHDVNAGLVQISMGADHLKFSAINLFRTFFQFHGNSLLILKEWLPMAVFGLGGLFLFAHGLFKSVQFQLFKIQSNDKKSNPSLRALQWALILHLAFAIYSVGNAEFMVMLPLLFILIAASLKWAKENYFFQMTVGLWIYQIIFAIAPMVLGSFNDVQLISEGINKLNSNRPILFISNQAVAVGNAMEYGHRNQGNRKGFNHRFLIGQNAQEISAIQQMVKSKLYRVITDDSYFLKQKSVTNRAKMSSFKPTETLMNQWSWKPCQSSFTPSPRREIVLYELQN